MSKRKQALHTTDTGTPLPDKRNSLSAGPRGPLRVRGSRLTKKPAHHPTPFARTIAYIGTQPANRTTSLNSNDPRST